MTAFEKLVLALLAAILRRIIFQNVTKPEPTDEEMAALLEAEQKSKGGPKQ